MTGATELPDRVGVIGATSFVGVSLLACFANSHSSVFAYTRGAAPDSRANVVWRKLVRGAVPEQADQISHWVSLAPIAKLPRYLPLLAAHGAKRLVVLSTTSRFTKLTSPDMAEQKFVRNVTDAESQIQSWAEVHGVEWVILRPTLIYGGGRDRNIAEITRFIRRFGFFPVFGRACGLRQPIHVQDVADACLASLKSTTVANRAYNISGAETITYIEMINRIFRLLGRQPRVVRIPLWMFSTAVFLLRRFPRYSKWSSAMAERMNSDMIFDHAEACRDFMRAPRAFTLGSEDLPE